MRSGAQLSLNVYAEVHQYKIKWCSDSSQKHKCLLQIGAHMHLYTICCRIRFDDLHSTGLYTWPFLYTLGCSKLSRAKDYIRQLRERGLSRNPPAPRPRTAAAAQKNPPGMLPAASAVRSAAQAAEQKQGT
jgi:hypothetical protein